MHAVIEFIKANVLCDILVGLGLLALYITYIGAPLASKKSGRYVSGIPCVGGILIALGFLTTPMKWLALFGFVDIYIPYSLIKGVPSIIKMKLDAYNGSAPRTVDGAPVVAYTTYYNRYSEFKEIINEENGSYRTIPIERLAIISLVDGSYQLLGMDYQFNVITRETYESIKECKDHAHPKAQKRWIDVNR